MEPINIPSEHIEASIPSSKQATAEWFVFGVSVFMLLLFSYTAVNKLLEYSKFVFQMQLAPLPILEPLAPILGWLVPLAELAIVACLYIERTRIRALVASLALMVSFEVYISWMRSTGLELPCTCGGIISAMGWATHFIFNAVVIGVIATALIRWKMITNKRKQQNTIH